MGKTSEKSNGQAVQNDFRNIRKKRRSRVSTPTTASMSPYTKRIIDKNENILKEYSINSR
ncbi:MULTISPECIES: hypothetical protein [Bacillus]|uniref:Uncharacterized protein n=2 Tax=Bacillus thuringiensis TaxID=1428 RepID=A0AAP4Q7C6_BACTU|nr:MULTISPECIES: hypothetical protein [Bacillus]MEC0045740.1 hypothetical protein [Bacillus cereus]AFV22039.1 hypothetical protein BTB_502p07340 [Bacillus thuringiensis Bt407]ERI00784.1 hypothetical protein BTCBT_002339 [Bacillus thuringiensis T01-328]MBN6707567.1 hypothetical protein [Bacillus thuringiensis]MDN7078605.1 hypothetical protein [Bacillus thuringiensis]